MSPWRPGRDHSPAKTAHSPRTRGSDTYWRRRPMPGEPPGSGDLLGPDGLAGPAAEAAAIRRVLDGAQLVTVTGLPGVGKTAVSLAAARAATTSFADGSLLLRLDRLRDEALLPYTIAARRGDRGQPEPARRALGAAGRPGRR